MASKQTQMAKEAKHLSDEDKAARKYMVDEKSWEAGDGEEFGGQSDILQLEEGEVGGPFTYVGHQDMTTDLGETTVHMGTGPDGETYRLPIQATFLRAVDQAGLSRGDTFLVRREADQIKKKGKGAGNPMAIYALKVKTRAPKPVAS